MAIIFDMLVLAVLFFAAIYVMAGIRKRITRSSGHLPRAGLRNGGNEPWECDRPNCRATNPGHARFCRVCGQQRERRDFPADEDGCGTCC